MGKLEYNILVPQFIDGRKEPKDCGMFSTIRGALDKLRYMIEHTNVDLIKDVQIDLYTNGIRSNDFLRFHRTNGGLLRLTVW